jgi:hypothetical protein
VKMGSDCLLAALNLDSRKSKFSGLCSEGTGFKFNYGSKLS